MLPTVSNKLVLFPRLSARLPAVLALGLVAVTGCGSSGPRKDDAALQGNSNVPAAPSVDRSKCSEKGKQVITSDTNQDKQPDVWKYFVMGDQGGQTVSILTCKLVDLNHDGKVDIVYHYDATGAQTNLEEFDLDFDGKYDMSVYYVNGKKVRKEEDTNFDQRPDVWSYFEEEKLVRVELDRNYDGKVDEWQYYEGGKIDRIGYDTSGSGRVDKWDRQPEGSEGGGASGGGTESAPAAAPPPAGTAPTAPPAAATAPPPAAPAKPTAPAPAKPTTPAPAPAPAPKK